MLLCPKEVRKGAASDTILTVTLVENGWLIFGLQKGISFGIHKATYKL